MKKHKYLIAANWKQNGDLKSLTKLVDDIIKLDKKLKPNCEILILPPSIYLNMIRDRYKHHKVSQKKLSLGIQNISPFANGAYTGETSISMIKDYKCSYALVGHSERREFFHEDNDLIRKKIHAVNASNLRPILCIGETKEENKEGITKDVLKNQLEVIDGLDLSRDFTIAYEPVWAIGSGLTPEPKDINDIHKYIKDVVQSVSANSLVPDVIYGGSVTNKNAKSFFVEEFVDGALIGGASLEGSTFGEIVNIWNEFII